MVPEKSSFFERHAELAMEQQVRYGIPASVTLIQMWHESGGGQSDVARNANNYFGVKDHAGAKAGRPVYIHDDADEKNAPFKVYGSLEASVQGHSQVLMGDRYKRLHNLQPTDYQGWLKGIRQCGYASDPDYAPKLIKDLEAYNLQQYDQKAVEIARAQGVRCGYDRANVHKGVATATGDRKAAMLGGFSFPVAVTNLIQTDEYDKAATSYRGHRHNGVDIQAKNVPVLATEAGIVQAVGFDKKGGGNFIKVEYPRQDGSSYLVSYCHLQSIDVKKGDTVTAGQAIGVSGMTGNCTGPHLHLTVRHKDAGTVAYNETNPSRYLAEIAVRGNLGTMYDQKSGKDILASYKAKVDKESLSPNSAEVLYAQARQDQQEQESKDRTIEETIERTAKSNGFLSAILGNDGSGLSQMFQGGSDLTSSIIQMLMMSFLALAFNKQDREEQQKQQPARDAAEKATRQEDYEVREQRVKDLAAAASERFEIMSPEQQGGQDVSQQQGGGYSMA